MEGLPTAQDRLIIFSKVLGKRRNGRLARLSDVIIEIEDGREVWAEARHETVAARSAHGDLTVSTVKHKACPCKSVCVVEVEGAQKSAQRKSRHGARAQWSGVVLRTEVGRVHMRLVVCQCHFRTKIVNDYVKNIGCPC